MRANDARRRIASGTLRRASHAIESRGCLRRARVARDRERVTPIPSTQPSTAPPRSGGPNREGHGARAGRSERATRLRPRVCPRVRWPAPPHLQLERHRKEAEGAERHVAATLKRHAWIASERGCFGVAGGPYDFDARDAAAATKELEALRSEQAALGKKVNRKVIGSIEKAETECCELMRKRDVVEGDRRKIEAVIAELDVKKNATLQATWVKVRPSAHF